MEDGSSISYFLSAVSQPISSMPLILDLLVLFILIFINAFFSASEIAIITLNDNMIKKRAEEGDRVSQRLYKLISEPSSFLATIQVGVTLAGFLSSAFAADKFSRRLYDILAVNNRAIYDISLVVVTIILSYFSLVFGELVPKRIAQNNPERMARRVVNIIRATGFVLRPFILLLTASTNLVLKLFGISPNANDRRVTEEEIRMLVDVGRESGSIHANEKEMIEKIFEFNDKRFRRS